MAAKICLVLLFASLLTQAQVDPSSRLSQTLKTNDSLLFNVGFNNCDIHQFDSLISNNFEFYHDEAGISSSKAMFIESIRNGMCKLAYKPKRKLFPNSLKVYPLEKGGVVYGAIQTGEHEFYAIEPGKPEYLTSTALFTHIWLLENGIWKLSRGFSYNHKNSKNEDIIEESKLFADRIVTEKWMVKNHIPALGIGYIENGIIKEATVYGKDENGKAYNSSTIFNVASLTKPITAMVTLQLVNEGKWSLDEPLYNYWIDPDVVGDPRAKKLTTRNILTHQSGFPNWRGKNDDGKLSFEFDPGTKYQYSGEGFEYLRQALEAKFKMPLDQLAGDIIFKPLKMKDTRFYWDATIDESRFAKWHKKDGTLYETYKNKTANAADDLLTSVEDYSKFLVFVMNGAGLKQELFTEMVTMQVKVSNRKYFGLGWTILEDVKNSENALEHGGDDIGVHTIAFILPKTKQGLVIFTNCDNGADAYIPAVQHYLGKAGQEIIDIETK